MESGESIAVRLIKYLLPPLIILVALGALILLFLARKAPPEREIERVLPRVEVLEIVPKTSRLTLHSQGVVQARQSTLLITEVSGVVEWVSPALYAGGFFENGEVLLRLEATAYESALASARVRLAQAELLHEQESALAEQARLEWENIGEGPGSDLTLRIPQLRAAAEELEAAKAAVRLAERDLRHTQVRAPYRGRVREKFVDVGQSLAARASQIASIYSVDAVEIRVSFSQQDAGLLELPELFVEGGMTGAQAPVEVIAEFGAQHHVWQGTLDRTEGAVDASTRLVYAVVRVDEPYASSDERVRPPLKVGMFVRVKIQGREIRNAVKLPREALQRENWVHVLDAQNRLEIRPVEVVHRAMDHVVVSEGLHEGERVILTRLQYATPGMQLDPTVSGVSEAHAGPQETPK